MERDYIHGRHWNIGFGVCEAGYRRDILSVFPAAAGFIGRQVTVHNVAVFSGGKTHLNPAVSFGAERARLGGRVSIDENKSQGSAAEIDLAIAIIPPNRHRIPVGIDRVTKSNHVGGLPPAVFAHRTWSRDRNKYSAGFRLG